MTLKTRLARGIFSRCFADLGGDWRDTVFVAGTGRSGTTWLGDLINYRNEYRVVFEPFHPRYVPDAACFRNRQYLRPDAQDDARTAAARRILGGRTRSRWSDGQNERLLARRRVVKEIRANLMLGWLRRQHPEMPMVLILRHPCAVAHSRATMGWQTHLDELLGQPELMADHLAPHVELLAGLRSAPALHAALWAVETLVPLRQLSAGDVFLIGYEELCLDPREVLGRLFAHLGQGLDDSILTALRRPSWVTRDGSAIARGKDPLTAWQREMNPDDVESVLAVVRALGLGAVYGKQAEPDVAAARALLHEAPAAGRDQPTESRR